MGKQRIEMDYGFIEYGGNEVTVASRIDDPPKYRLAAPFGLSLGAVTGSRLRPDGGQDEMAILQFKQDERTRADPNSRVGEMSFLLRKGASGNDDADFVEVMIVRHDGIWVHGRKVV